VTYTHEYPKTIVRLAFCRVTGWEGEPAGVEGQRLAWVRPGGDLEVGPLLPATEPPLRWIQLPDRYLLTAIGGAAGLDDYLAGLEQGLRDGLKLVQFREPEWMAGCGGLAESGTEIHAAFQRVVRLCHRYGARCLLNSCHPESWWAQADGVHFRAADAGALVRLAPRPGTRPPD